MEVLQNVIPLQDQLDWLRGPFLKLHRPLFLILFLLFSSCFTEVEIKLHYPSAFSTLLTFRNVPCGSYVSKFRCTVT